MSATCDQAVKADGRHAASVGDAGMLAMPPARRFAIAAGVKARHEPAKYGLAAGDARVVLNAGHCAGGDDATRALMTGHGRLGIRNGSPSIMLAAANAYYESSAANTGTKLSRLTAKSADG